MPAVNSLQGDKNRTTCIWNWPYTTDCSTTGETLSLGSILSSRWLVDIGVVRLDLATLNYMWYSANICELLLMLSFSSFFSLVCNYQVENIQSAIFQIVAGIKLIKSHPYVDCSAMNAIYSNVSLDGNGSTKS